MASCTVDEAKRHLEAWKAADLALATGKEYQIGTRSITRANATEVKERIQFWTREVAKLQGTYRRTRRVVPYDL